jgi:hypothetical protein
MTDDEFNQCMATLFAYYTKKLDTVLSQLYASRFIHYQYIDFYNAVNIHIDAEEFERFPTIAQLKSLLPVTKKLAIESKISCLCENSHRLIKQYHPETGSYFKTLIGNTSNLEVEK